MKNLVFIFVSVLLSVSTYAEQVTPPNDLLIEVHKGHLPGEKIQHWLSIEKDGGVIFTERVGDYSSSQARVGELSRQTILRLKRQIALLPREELAPAAEQNECFDRSPYIFSARRPAGDIVTFASITECHHLVLPGSADSIYLRDLLRTLLDLILSQNNSGVARLTNNPTVKKTYSAGDPLSVRGLA